MAKVKKSKKSYLKGIASKGARPIGTYHKYGDYSPHEVHKGTTSYRGRSYTDVPGTDRTLFARGVDASGKSKFIFQNRLYKVTGPAGAHEEVRK